MIVYEVYNQICLAQNLKHKLERKPPNASSLYRRSKFRVGGTLKSSLRLFHKVAGAGSGMYMLMSTGTGFFCACNTYAIYLNCTSCSAGPLMPLIITRDLSSPERVLESRLYHCERPASGVEPSFDGSWLLQACTINCRLIFPVARDTSALWFCYLYSMLFVA